MYYSQKEILDAIRLFYQSEQLTEDEVYECIEELENKRYIKVTHEEIKKIFTSYM